MKCSDAWCARDATDKFHGLGRSGRPPKDSVGIPYCHMHYQRLCNEAKATRAAQSERRAAVLDCAYIAERQGYPELAELLRKLTE